MNASLTSVVFFTFFYFFANINDKILNDSLIGFTFKVKTLKPLHNTVSAQKLIEFLI